MTFNSKVFFSICISILVHIFFVMNFLNDENKDQEIYVLNLSNYQQVQFEKQKSIPKEIEKTPDVEIPKKDEKKVEKKLKKIKKKSLSNQLKNLSNQLKNLLNQIKLKILKW